MARPVTTVLLKDNKVLGAGMEVITSSEIDNAGVSARDNQPLPRYSEQNLKEPDRSRRSRIEWNSEFTPTGKKCDAVRFVIDCGVPVKAEAFGLIDCNAKSGKVRLYGTDNRVLLDPGYGTLDSAITNPITEPDVIMEDFDLSEAPVSGINMFYPEDTDWNWASRAQLDYYSYIAGTSYQVPAGQTSLLTAGLRRDAVAADSDRRNHEGRALESGVGFQGMAPMRPHTVRYPDSYVNYDGVTRGSLAGDAAPIIIGDEELLRGQEDRGLFDVVRGNASPTALGEVGRSGIDPIYWLSSDYRGTGNEAYWQVDGATKPVGWHGIPAGTTSSASAWGRSSADTLGVGIFNVTTVGARLTASTSEDWFSFMSRGGDTSSYEGFFATNGHSAANMMRLYYWNPNTHPGRYFYVEVPDSLLGDWHVWQFILLGWGTEEMDFLVDGVSYGPLDVFTFTGGDTQAFGSLNYLKAGHRQSNAAIRAIDGHSNTQFGQIDIAYMSLSDWGYGVAVPSDMEYLNRDAQAQYQQASYDLGIREDDLKRRYWCVEFDELRGDMKIPGDYLELGGVWIGERTDLVNVERISTEQERSGERSSESYSGSQGVLAGSAVRRATIEVMGKTIAESSDFASDMIASTNAVVMLDSYPNSPELRDGGILMGALSDVSLQTSTLRGSRVGMTFQESRPFVAYTGTGYKAESGWDSHHGGIIDATGKAVTLGTTMIYGIEIQPGERAHLLISDPLNSYAQVPGPAAGVRLTAGLLSPNYDPETGQPGDGDWDMGVRITSMNYQDGWTGYDSARASANSWQDTWITNGAPHLSGVYESGTIFSSIHAISVDYKADNTIEGTLGAGTSDPAVAITVGTQNSSEAVYGSRRFALHWGYSFGEYYVRPSLEVGSFPATISFIDIP
jgi:hypothetical protein